MAETAEEIKLVPTVERARMLKPGSMHSLTLPNPPVFLRKTK